MIGVITTQQKFHFPDSALGALPASLRVVSAQNGQIGVQILFSCNAASGSVHLEGIGFDAKLHEMIAIPVEYNTGNGVDQGGAMVILPDTCPDYAVRKAPFDVFDCLRPVEGEEIPSRNSLCSAYLNIAPKEDTPAGSHALTLTLRAGEETHVCQIEYVVYPVSFDEDLFETTNWFSVRAMEQVADLFDSYHVQREYNRDLPHLCALKAWADGAGKKLVMLANSGCFAHCAGQIFHDNLVAHESEICETQNLNDFLPYVCWRTLKDPKMWHTVLQNTWVRPEDLHHYEGIFDTVKLATRMHSHPGLVIDAYSRRSFYGNTLDLFEPGFGRAFAPYVIDNRAFPENWFHTVTNCDKACYKCNYCKSVLEKVLLNTEE